MSKYGNLKCTAFGVLFDSEAERNYAYKLVSLQNSGLIKNLVFHKPDNVHILFNKKRKPEWVIEAEKHDRTIRRKYKNLPSVRYISDFEYDDLRDGRHHIIDVKGMVTPVYKIKKALMYWLFDLWVEEVKV